MNYNKKGRGGTRAFAGKRGLTKAKSAESGKIHDVPV